MLIHIHREGFWVSKKYNDVSNCFENSITYFASNLIMDHFGIPGGLDDLYNITVSHLMNKRGILGFQSSDWCQSMSGMHNNGTSCM